MNLDKLLVQAILITGIGFILSAIMLIITRKASIDCIIGMFGIGITLALWSFDTKRIYKKHIKQSLNVIIGDCTKKESRVLEKVIDRPITITEASKKVKEHEVLESLVKKRIIKKELFPQTNGGQQYIYYFSYDENYIDSI